MLMKLITDNHYQADDNDDTEDVTGRKSRSPSDGHRNLMNSTGPEPWKECVRIFLSRCNAEKDTFSNGSMPCRSTVYRRPLSS